MSLGSFWSAMWHSFEGAFQEHGPPPLRSSRFPAGLPGLKGLHAIKLRAADRLYGYMRKLIKQLQLAHVICTVENPLTNLLWEHLIGQMFIKQQTPITVSCATACLVASVKSVHVLRLTAVQ